MSIIGRPLFSQRDEFDDAIELSPIERYASLARAAVKRRTVIIIAGVAAILIALSAYLLFIAGNASSTAALNEKTKVAVAMPIAGETPPPVGPDVTANWTALEPAHKSYKIQIGNDNSLQSNQQAIELYGVNILPRGKICTYRNGERWACGQRAYVALLNILGASAVDCRPQQTNQPRTVVCHLAGSDIAELMLREGWATLASGMNEQRYTDAAARAFAAKTGMWSLQPVR